MSFFQLILKRYELDDERKLKDWFTSGTTDLRVLAFSFDGQYSEEAIRQKLQRIGLLKEEQQLAALCSSSSKLKLPEVGD